MDDNVPEVEKGSLGAVVGMRQETKGGVADDTEVAEQAVMLLVMEDD